MHDRFIVPFFILSLPGILNLTGIARYYAPVEGDYQPKEEYHELWKKGCPQETAGTSL